MKIYLASRYSRLEQVRAAAAELRGLGHVITSRWIDGNHRITDEGMTDEDKELERMRFALEDLADVMAARCTISFTEEPRTPTRGGRHTEFGVALAMKQLLILIGPREHVFHALPQVSAFGTLKRAFPLLQFMNGVKEYAEAVS